MTILRDKENSDGGGIRTHVTEDTATWTKRHRPLGHPAYVVNFERASVYVRDLLLGSKASQKFVGYCKRLSKASLNLKTNNPSLFVR